MKCTFIIFHDDDFSIEGSGISYHPYQHNKLVHEIEDENEIGLRNKAVLWLISLQVKKPYDPQPYDYYDNSPTYAQSFKIAVYETARAIYDGLNHFRLGGNRTIEFSIEI